MKTAIAIFVKTPGFTPLKTRLAATTGTDAAMEFYRLSLKAIESTVMSSDIDGYWAVGEQEALGHDLWQGLTPIWTEGGDLGQRQFHIYQSLIKKYDRVLLIGADAPQLSVDLIKQACQSLDTQDFVFGPAHDGGYYLFGGRIETDAAVWDHIEWSTEKTLSQLEQSLPSPAAHLAPLTDIDTEGDLTRLAFEMPENMNDAQKAIIKWVKARKPTTNPRPQPFK